MASVYAQPPLPLEPDLLSLWELEPGVVFLNHGSFGAAPRAVTQVANDWRRKIEAQPIELLGRQWKQLVAAAKEPVARFLKADSESIGFVTNATEGVNCVLRSLQLKPGEELLTTTHVYHAVRQAMKYAALQSGASYRELELPLPIGSVAQIAETIAGSLRAETRLLVVDHVTSPTALVFPIESIADACKRRGVELLVDGAHAPGMVPLDLSSLGLRGVDFYTGNLHKWCCAPKGTAFLWAREDRRDQVKPLVISHWYDEGMSAAFHWQGTRDHAGWLSAGAAIDFLGQFAWPRVQQHNHAMAVWAQGLLCDRLNVAPISPADGILLGSMATVRLPPAFATLDEGEWLALQQALYTNHRVEVPLVSWGGERFFRVSCQIYNKPEDYQRLADVLTQCL